MQLDQSVFFISGGASGLGAAAARHIVVAGGYVLIADINDEAGTALAKELGARARYAHTDVTNESSVQAALAEAVNGWGRINGLLCCAGIAPGMKVLSKEGPHSLEVFERAIRINLIGTFNCIRLAAAIMQNTPANAEGERGVIICTASIAAYEGQIGQAAYSASKAGVVGMVLPIARELARYGIRIMAVAPGIFETPMLAALPKEVQDSIGRSVPFPARLGRAAEFALLVDSIVRNPMLNGEVIRIDGATRLAAK